jgi:DNA invertase Pin-like site-specific DNA recombinase
LRIAYARVSTDAQELHRQLDALEKVGYDKLIQEKFTGTKKDRAGLQKLFDIVREGDVVIVESISRLGRNTLDILTIIEELTNKGIMFKSLKENMDTTTPTGKAMLGMIAVISQLERDLIVQRTQEGLASAKKRGIKLGRPALDDKKVNHALYLYDKGDLSVKQILEATGISQGKFYKELNKRKLTETMEDKKNE